MDAEEQEQPRSEPDARARRDDVARALEPLLQPGDLFLVCRDEDAVAVTPLPSDVLGTRSPLRLLNPELYGLLLAIDQRISDASGCLPKLIATTGAVALSFAVHGRLFHGLTAEPRLHHLLDELRSGWTYALIGVVALAALIITQGWQERLAYERERRALSERLLRERAIPYEVVSQMEGDDSLSFVSKHMKRDPRWISEGF